MAVGAVNLRGGFYANASLYNGQAYGQSLTGTAQQPLPGDVNTEYQAHGYTAEIGSLGPLMANESYNIYVDYVSNFADTLAFIPDNGTGLQGPLTAQVPAVAAHATYAAGPFTTYVDYVSAVDTFNATQWTYNGSAAKPSAFSLEGDYTMTAWNKAAVFAVGYQGSQQAAGFIPSGGSFPMPASRFDIAYNLYPLSNFKVGIEYDYDEDYGINDVSNIVGTSYTGTGQSDNTVTLRLSAWF